jgi:hypothetical protein
MAASSLINQDKLVTRKTFFSFHYERDVWRAGQVRNSNIIPSENRFGFIDSVDWHSIEIQGRAAIEQWIAKQLHGTSVTAVLIGTETATRPWVQYEILESWKRGNGIVGVRIHNVRDNDSRTDSQGANPFDQFTIENGVQLASICKTYDWVIDTGRHNLGRWIDEAFQIRSRYQSREIQLNSRPAVYQPYSLSTSAAAVSFTPRAPWCP